MRGAKPRGDDGWDRLRGRADGSASSGGTPTSAVFSGLSLPVAHLFVSPMILSEHGSGTVLPDRRNNELTE